MSRIGKKPIKLESGVKAELKNGVCTLESSNGKISVPVCADLECEITGDIINLSLKGTSKHAKAMWGTVRALLANAATGLHKPFSRTLDLKGIGYKAKIEGNKLNLALGFTPFDMIIPADVKVVCPTATQIVVSGIDKQRVGLVASEIRAKKKPGAYHGEGIRYSDEKVILKAAAKK